MHIDFPRGKTRSLAPRAVAAFVVLLLFSPVLLQAQTGTAGTIVGTVTDATGAVVPNATVTLQDIGTNQTFTVKTNSSGQYVFPRISPGRYRLSANADGFRTSNIPEIKVEVAKSHLLDVRLEVGAASEVVEVTAEARIELQTTDAAVGNVLGRDELMRLPAFTRGAGELLTLQPAAQPITGNANTGGTISGARSDQNTFSLDGIDITDNSIGGGGTLRTVIAVPIDFIEEFRTGVANPNATFGRSAGGQVTMISRRGTNDFHGSVYWFHQNDALNANSWTNNFRKIPEPETKDNRFGGRIGGPIWKDKTFFFFLFDGRRFPRSSEIVRVIPSETLKQGVLAFPDGTGAVQLYNLSTSTACGPAGGLACDPRGLGMSPTIQTLFGLYPVGNDPTASSGSFAGTADGLNTVGFRDTVGNPLNDNNYIGRVDHNITSKWQFHALGTYFKQENLSASQVDIRGGDSQAIRNAPTRGNSVITSLVGQITPTLVNTFRFGWVRDRTAANALSPSASAALLGLPGADTSAGAIAIEPSTIIDGVIDVHTQVARTQSSDNQNFQFVDDVSWVRGNHTFQFGTQIRHLPILHVRNDKVIGSLASLVARPDDGDFVNISADARPRTCTGAGDTNCILAADVTRWNKLYALTLGIMDNVNILAARDADLNPLPFGAPLSADTTLRAYDFYVQDTWRVTSSLTLTYGLAYGWQTPPTEKDGKQTFIISKESGQLLSAETFLETKRQAALQGNTFSPDIAYLPINSSGRDQIHKIDWDNVSPRLAVAWNPSFDGGFLGRLFGERKTVLRGGFNIQYDRLNTVQSVIIPMLGVGFAQTINRRSPSCTSSGPGGAACGVNASHEGSVFRIGVDGEIPLPTLPAVTIPIVPAFGLSELLSFQIDPNLHVGKNYAANFTIQRELPWEMVAELGWLGRWARDLPQSVNFNSSPYFHIDSASGQSFAEAYDALAAEVRGGVAAASVTPQPWFENQYTTTAGAAAQFASQLQDGNISQMFLTMNLTRVLGLGMPSFDNLQVLELFMRTHRGESEYNAFVATLRKRPTQGLSFDLNYSWSKSLDSLGAVQNTANYLSNSYFPNIEWGPSSFDRTHVFNGLYNYDLPFGRGHRLSTGSWFDKVISGWWSSGIFRATSGSPLTVSQAAGVFGGGFLLPFASGAIPTVPLDNDNSIHTDVDGTNGIGTGGDRSTTPPGTGFNLFANPEGMFNAFRKIRISEDQRTGRGVLRGLPRWNFDMSLGKQTAVTERVSLGFRFDFFNIFNHVDFNDPTLSLTNKRAFGVVNSQFVPGDRTTGSRWIQFGLRVEF